MTPSVSTARMESVTQIELPEDVIDVCDVFKSFMHPSGESIEVLSGVNLSVRRQEFLSIIGPSGCGKSTIFNCIFRFIRPTFRRYPAKHSGRIRPVIPMRSGQVFRSDPASHSDGIRPTHPPGCPRYLKERSLLQFTRNQLEITIGTASL